MAKNIGLFIALLILLLLHTPFLQADPDGLLAWHSRGAWTDEGLYTAQIRNYINSGHFDINQSDGFAKAPLFSIFIMPFLYLFGTHLWVARLAILLFSLLTTHKLIKAHFAGITSYWAWAIISLQYFVFNYSHFAMAEMLGASCIVWAGIYYTRFAQTQQVKQALYAAVFLLGAAGCKINYLYSLSIMPLCIIILLMQNLVNKQYQLAKNKLKALSYITCIYLLVFICLYIVFYTPNKELYTKIFLQDVAVKFESRLGMLDILGMNGALIFDEPALLVYFVLMVITICAALYSRLLKKAPAPSSTLIQFTCIWLLAELHKLFVFNMAARYLVPLFLCMSILIAATCLYLYQHNFKKLSWAIVIVITMINGIYWQKANANRSFQIQKINNYLAATANSKQNMLGTWAPTACWDSKNTTLPVWEGYFNDTGFMEKYRPQAIITEEDERDAGYIFSKRGINLKQQSDSIRVFRIAEWSVAVHWLKK